MQIFYLNQFICKPLWSARHFFFLYQSTISNIFREIHSTAQRTCSGQFFQVNTKTSPREPTARGVQHGESTCSFPERTLAVAEADRENHSMEQPV